jgi:hypothetical protein
MARNSGTTKELINLALKEYDALRKGIDDRADVTKTYGWPVVLLSVGAIAGLKSDLVSVSVALTFIPAIVMSIAALDANANHDKARARRDITLVEDKIFILLGESSLCHESNAFLRCREIGLPHLKRAVAYTVVYALVEATISLLLLRPNLGSIDWVRTFLFGSVMSIPAILFLYSAYGAFKIFTAPYSTMLLEHIAESKTLERDGQRLLYNTKPPQSTPVENAST